MEVKFRKDTTDYIVSSYYARHMERPSRVLFNAYEIDGKIYAANYLESNFKKDIMFYSSYSFFVSV